MYTITRGINPVIPCNTLYEVMEQALMLDTVERNTSYVIDDATRNKVKMPLLAFLDCYRKEWTDACMRWRKYHRL